MTLALVLLPFTVLLFWSYGILAPLLAVVAVLCYFAVRRYAK